MIQESINQISPTNLGNFANLSNFINFNTSQSTQTIQSTDTNKIDQINQADNTNLIMLENIITELELKLTSAQSLDINYVLDCLIKINNYDVTDSIKTKMANIKIILGMEIAFDLKMINLTNKNIKFNFDLNKIDICLGTTVRSKLVKYIVSENINVNPNEILQSPITKQIEDKLGKFLELITLEELNVFPKEWEIRHWLFCNFSDRLKLLITNNLQNINLLDSRTLVTHVRVVRGFENKFKEIIYFQSNSLTDNTNNTNNINKINGSEDSIINCYDNSLIQFITELKTDSVNKLNEINNLFRLHEYTISITSEHTRESAQLSISDYTNELFGFLGKRLFQCGTISTGESYFLLVQHTMNLIKDHMIEINKKYTNEKKIQGNNYNSLLEFVLMNIICTSECSMQLLESLRAKILLNIQSKYKKNTNDCVDNVKNFISEIFSNSVIILVSETIKGYQPYAEKLKSFSFSEKSKIKSKDIIHDYIKLVIDKYSNTLLKISKYMNEYCINEISKKMTLDTLDAILNHLLSLSNVHYTHSDNFDIIVEMLLKKTTYLMGDIEGSTNKIINGDTQIGVMQDGTTVTIRLKIFTKIAKIREFINALSIKNQEYTEEKHLLIFGNDQKIKYDMINTVKGNINIKNAPIVAMGVMGEAVGTVTKPVTNMTMVGVNGLTKIVGMDSSIHSNSSDKDKKFDDVDFTAISNMMSDAKKMFSLKGKKISMPNFPNVSNKINSNTAT